MKTTRSPLSGWPAAVPPPETPAPAAEPEVVPVKRRSQGRTGDVLGLAWVHGALHAARFRRQAMTDQWAATTPVVTIEEFSTALDVALAALDFDGTDVFLLLAHDEFVHQTETAPSFSESAARAYLRGRVERLEKEREPLMWVSQRANAAKKEASYILHLLPVAFYHRLNEALLERRLELSRILPLHVPLQLALATLSETRNVPILLAAAAGSSTAVLVGRTGSDILFSRTILESWKKDPARVAVEVNRSLLYAKQQFGATVDLVWLLGEGGAAAREAIAGKCGANTGITAKEVTPVDWLQATCRLSVRHPVNLVAPFTREKQRSRFIRRLLVAACWMGLAWMGFDFWNVNQKWAAENVRLQALQSSAPALETERAQLEQRNAEIIRQRAFLDVVSGERQPPVAERFVAYVAAILPREAQLKEANVKWDEATDRWAFQLSGTIEADADAAAAMVQTLRRQLTRSPLQARFVETVRGPSAFTSATSGAALIQPFSLEGGLFEN